MSQDELVRGIRRIVGEQDEKPTGLGDAEARKPIGISRGVGLLRGDGSVAGSGGEGGGNDTSPPDVPVEQPGDGGSVPGDGGNVGGGGGGGKTPVNGDAADVNDSLTGGSLVGTVTGTDPTTANFTSVKFDSLAGIEYTPPDGWDDPDTAPPPEYYTAGKYWSLLNSTIPAPGTRVSADDPDFVCGDPSIAGSAETRYDPNTNSCEFYNGSFWQTNAPIYHVSCDGEPGPPPSGNLCDTYTPPDTDWPSDGTCQVAYDHEAGGYKGHVKDPDCSAAQKTAAGFVILRSQSDPSRYFRYTRLADGGTKITEVDSGGVPKPGTVTKILDGAGNVTGFVDVTLDNFYQ